MYRLKDDSFRRINIECKWYENSIVCLICIICILFLEIFNGKFIGLGILSNLNLNLVYF